MPETTAWLSYDSVADIYERVAVPWFTPLAADLIAAVSPARGETVLDVGTGTGLVARLACARVTSTGRVLGIDPSVPMLRKARRPGIHVVGAVTPGLPVRDDSVDVVVANLVLSHLPDVHASLVDMARVLRPAGRMGVTAWAGAVPEREGNQQPAADRIVRSVMDEAGMPSSTPCAGAPHEDDLRDPEYVVSQLRSAGLVGVRIERRRATTTFTVDEYLSGWGSLARYQRCSVGDERWAAFRARAADELRTRLGTGVTSVSQAWIASGTQPGP
jgi:SAM-dependent methyltransferase